MSDRNIIVTYYDEKGEEIRSNRCKHPRKAVMLAGDHLSQDHYWHLVGTKFMYAKSAVIYDEGTAELHAVITVNAYNQIQTEFKRDHQNPTCITI